MDQNQEMRLFFKFRVGAIFLSIIGEKKRLINIGDLWLIFVWGFGKLFSLDFLVYSSAMK